MVIDFFGKLSQTKLPGPVEVDDGGTINHFLEFGQHGRPAFKVFLPEINDWCFTVDVIGDSEDQVEKTNDDEYVIDLKKVDHHDDCDHQFFQNVDDDDCHLKV